MGFIRSSFARNACFRTSAYECWFKMGRYHCLHPPATSWISALGIIDRAEGLRAFFWEPLVSQTTAHPYVSLGLPRLWWPSPASENVVSDPPLELSCILLVHYRRCLWNCGRNILQMGVSILLIIRPSLLQGSEEYWAGLGLWGNLHRLRLES